jgi:AraC-like DNA-binding protein
LIETDEQIAQVAYQLGYEHPGQIVRDFLHMFGITPRRFRLLSKSEPS